MIQGSRVSTWLKCWECHPVQDYYCYYFFSCTLYFGGGAHPWTQQLAVHAPCYFLSNTPLISFRLPIPCFSCLTCSSFCPVAEELISERGRGCGGGGAAGAHWLAAVQRCLEEAALTSFACAISTSGAHSFHLKVDQPSHLSMNPHAASSSCLALATAVLQLRPPPLLGDPLLHSYNKMQSASGTPHYRVTLKQVKQMPDRCSCSVHRLWLLQIPRCASCLYVFVCDI